MSSIQRLVSFIVITLLGLTTVAFADPIEEAVIAALQGPESRRLKIFNHEFYVKPIISLNTITDKTVIVGQISHYRGKNWLGYDVTDDQVYYTIVKVDGRIQSIDRKINRGGYSSLLYPVSTALGWVKIPFTPVSVDQVQDALDGLDYLITGKWESVADFLISHIALRVDLGTEVNIDRFGLDYATLPVSGAQQCRTACDDDPVCKAWTYMGSLGRCWLKAGVPAPQPNTCCVSGVMRLLD